MTVGGGTLAASMATSVKPAAALGVEKAGKAGAGDGGRKQEQPQCATMGAIVKHDLALRRATSAEYNTLR